VRYVEANDYFLINPEPVVRLAFSAPKETLDQIMKSRKATLYPRFAVGSAAGPGWFRPAVSTNGLSQFQLKGDREFLWIDETGTNAFYLLFRV